MNTLTDFGFFDYISESFHTKTEEQPWKEKRYTHSSARISTHNTPISFQGIKPGQGEALRTLTRQSLCGKANHDYDIMFKRLLPGQLLECAFYSPMSITELSTELGIGSVYFEDEIKVLEKYGFIEKSEKGKYQTSLLL